MEYLRKPWDHQLKAIEQAFPLTEFYYAFEPGAGKTMTAINTVRKVWNEKRRTPRTLIVCPPIVIPNWKDEWLSNSKIPSAMITPLFGAGKKRLELFRERAFKFHGLVAENVPHIFITNYEALLMEDLFNAFLYWEPEVVILDEIHKVKDPKAKRSKLADRLVNGRMKVKKEAGTQTLVGPRPYVYGLSGTPILKNPMDLFQQYKILDGGKTFGTNFFSFRGTYFYDKNSRMNKQNYFPDWQPIPGAMEAIAKKLSVNSMRVLKKDCMDLPPLVEKTIKVPMTSEQKRVYKDMLEDYVAYVTNPKGNDHVVQATMAMTKSLRLMQIASGYMKTVEGQEVSLSGKDWNPKQEALFELLEDLVPNHKVIIWTIWKPTYDQIRAVCERLKIKFVEIHGGINDKEKYANVAAFNGEPDVRVLFGHPRSGGIGINLVAASQSIVYSRGFSLEDTLQSDARNYRGGSDIHESITRYHLVTEGTLEEKVQEKLSAKVDISDRVLREITLGLVRGS